ncbi:lipoate-protein ligase LplJ [Oceanobacillus oncorhynchi subsp. incaldanensis]|uniref:lipoate--protein ligase n=1 Tax=Oceanobacillus oncorhynchi TaxID=545501 RepID=A0A0A1MF63_9BACI|nr:lipoate--protein ligase [Oceanobacillus oncorhynchi]UUI38357.1 lipoate--protein ligase [Oceanobacillus oncorhynchi]GIO16910.1 lipoate-protein ligase LplJ [Oceanobacillus oncorhynchi subsp. incaldanensis]CEI84035.1 Lipoate-protein ligase LplJ [Oceanobacillus oncorhynchi]
MKFIDNKGITDPQINLAIEEYILENFGEKDTYLLFYVNSPSIIIGRNQNTIEEINTDYVDEQGIKVVRRLSGGGAVYHDEQNLNFSFITKDDGNSFQNFAKFTQPVVDALNNIGVPVELQGRNDLAVEGRKISGNAMFSTRGRMFSHGTLMLDSQLEELTKALKVKKIKIESKGIKSIRSRVANIAEYLDSPISMDEFKELILRYIFDVEDVNDVPQYVLTDEDWAKIHEISEKRYQQWEWNYGKSPSFNYQESKKFPGGLVDVRLDVKKGIIENCTIFGDFFGLGDVKVLEDALTGIRHNRDAVKEAVDQVDVSHYLGRISKEEFLELLY